MVASTNSQTVASRPSILVVAGVALGVLGVLAAGGLVASAGVSAQPLTPELYLDPEQEFNGAPFEAHARGFLPREELSWFWDGEPLSPDERAGPARTRAYSDGSAFQTFSVPVDAKAGRHVVSVVGETDASASAPFFVTSRPTNSVYRLPSSTTSTAPGPGSATTRVTDTDTGDASGTATAPPDEAATPSDETGGDRRRSATSTTRDERDVPDRFGLSFEDGGDGGPPSWLPALVPGAIVAGVFGRLFARQLSRGRD